MGLLVIGLIGGAVWRAWPRERLLTEVAHPVAHADFKKTTACWLSVHQLLLVTTSQEVNLADNMVRKDWRGSADVLDTTTHVTTHLDGLTRLLNRIPKDPMHGPEEFESSPDGTWILWETNSGGDGWPWPHAAHPDGTHACDWRDNGNEEKFFIDSNQLVHLSRHAGMMVLDMASKEDHHPQKAQTQAILARYALRHPRFVRVPDAEEVAGKGFAEIALYRTQDRLQRIESEESATLKSPVPLWAWRLNLPEGTTYQHAEASQEQQTVLYDLTTSRLPTLFAWLHRVYPRFDPEPTFSEELWVARADGQGRHKIGFVPTLLDEHSNPVTLLQEVRWLPDGKRISFIYRDTLYVVPAEPE